MIWYSAAIVPFIWMTYHFRVNALAGMFLIGAVAGYFIEALIVPAVYFELPTSILWTALTWHPLVDIIFGFWIFQVILRLGSLGKVILASIILGVLWGVWGNWAVGSESDIEEVVGMVPFYDIATAATFFFVSTAVLIVGNIGLDRFAGDRFEITKVEKGIILASTLFFVGHMALLANVLVLILPFMLGIFWIGLRKSKRSDDQKSFMEVFVPAVPWHLIS